MRLNRYLSQCGIASRRGAEQIISEGRVSINGHIITNLATQVEPDDKVIVDGKPVQSELPVVLALNKPKGYLCSRGDTHDRMTIYDLLPDQWRRRNPAVTSVGRLDKETSGLLLVTDIGDIVHRHTSPRSAVEKVYLATLDHDLDPKLIEVFARGDLMLRSEEKPCLPAKLEIVDALTARLTITEGRYHQVRRMFASQGWKVEALHRERVGEYTLEGIAEGEWLVVETPAV